MSEMVQVWAKAIFGEEWIKCRTWQKDWQSQVKKQVKRIWKRLHVEYEEMGTFLGSGLND